MSPLQPVGPYQPNPVTRVERSARERRQRDKDSPGGDSDPAAHFVEASVPPGDASAPEASAVPPRHAANPLDPDEPGHLVDLKA